MRNFFRRRSSRDIACDRLKILLISDRVNCSEDMMEMLKKDIAKVISRYMKIDAANMEIQINTRGKGSKGGRTPTLNANIPILDMHNQ